MKRFKLILAAAAMVLGASTASAQYYQMANQLTNMIRPALTGGFNYRGSVEAGYTFGIGARQADFLEITTTQGFKYADWFFMGVGAGVDFMFAHTNDGKPTWDNPDQGLTKNGVMIPLYSDFRFTAGSPKDVAFVFDLRIGASFLVGKDYIQIGDGYLTNSECFYLKPSIGMRIPVSDSNPKQAFTVAATYQLLTSNYWYHSSNDITLSSFGVTLGFEW